MSNRYWVDAPKHSPNFPECAHPPVSFDPRFSKKKRHIVTLWRLVDHNDNNGHDHLSLLRPMQIRPPYAPSHFH